MALHLPTRLLKSLCWYRDVNPVPTNPLADDTATAPLGPVHQLYKPEFIHTSDLDSTCMYQLAHMFISSNC